MYLHFRDNTIPSNKIVRQMVDKVNFVQLMLVANPIALFTSEGGCLQRMHLFLQVLWYCKSQLYSTIATSVCNLSNSVRYKLNLDLNYEHATYLIKISNNFIEQSQAFFSFISNRRLWVKLPKVSYWCKHDTNAFVIFWVQILPQNRNQGNNNYLL